ncbi:MAG: metal ABC transporter solute-binding protein, Zn/Mn family [Janthinobacterium lividum]
MKRIQLRPAMRLAIRLVSGICGLHGITAYAATPLVIVAAEDVYGNMARSLGGSHVSVTSILTNPDQDPHLFEISPSIARAVAGAAIVVSNGIGYDPWMATLIAASSAQGKPARSVLVVADLIGRHAGDNPHLWYDPITMPAYARGLSALLARRDPANTADYAVRLDHVLAAVAPVAVRAAALKSRYAGTPVTATEPVFGNMASALGLDMHNQRFQLAVMNDTEPAVSDVVLMEQDLRQRRVRLLFFNSQATNSAARRLETVARQAGIPVVGVTETEPHDQDYTQWMLAELDAVDHALDHPPGHP